MKNKSNRRNFIKHVGLGSIATSVLPSSLLANEAVEKKLPGDFNAEEIKGAHAYNGTYSGEYLNRIAFPVGGLGAGMFCVEGTGAVSNMSIRNRPDVFNEPQFFAGLSVKGIANGAKVVEGP